MANVSVRPQRPNCQCFLSFFQEVSSLGLQPVWTTSDGGTETNVVSLLNCTYDLIQLHHRSLRSLENLEVENLRSSSNMESLQLIRTRLKVSNNDSLCSSDRGHHIFCVNGSGERLCHCVNAGAT